MALSLRTLDHVVLVVEDLDRAVRFYVDVLGLPLKHRAPAFAQLQTTRRSPRSSLRERWRLPHRRTGRGHNGPRTAPILMGT